MGSAMKERVFSIGKFLFGWPISIIALLFLFKTFLSQSANVLEHLRTVSVPLLIPGILCFLAYYFLRSFIWYRMIVFAKHQMDPRESLFVWSFAQLRRYIPGNIWAVLGVAAEYSKRNVSKKDVSAYILWETEIVVIAAVLLSILAGPFVLGIYFQISNVSPLIYLLVLLILGAGVAIYCYNRRVFAFAKGKIRSALEHVFPSYTPLDSFQLIFYMLVSFLFLGLGYFFISSSITYFDPNSIWVFIGFFTVSLLAGFASVITPSGLGVREGMLTVFLGNFMPVALAAFISIFCRFVLIICEVIFVAFAFTTHKLRVGRLNKWLEVISKRPHEAILGLSFLTFSWYFTVVSFLRYDNFYTGRFDLGNMSQTVWNTLHGRIFEFTNPNGTETISRMAFHADVILIAFAPFYFLWESPKLLLLIQVLIVGAGAFFVYAVSLYLLKSRSLSLAISILFLLNPSLQRSIIYDFHAVTLATTFLLGAMYFVFKKRYAPFILFAVLAGLCKEQVWAVIGLMGLYVAFVQKKWRLGISTFLISLLIAVALVLLVIPHASGGGQHFALEYYASADESGSAGGLVKRFLFSPQNTVELLTQEDRLMYLKKLLEPLGYLPLLAPGFLIFAFPDLFINILSSKPELYQIYYQYTAVITPFLFIALIYGLAWFLKKFDKVPKTLVICYILFVGLYGAYRYGPLPGAKEPNTEMISKPYPNKESLDELVKSIPESASVSTTNSIGSHLSHRRYLYSVPLGMGSADYVIVDNSDDNLPDPLSDYATKSANLKEDPSYILFYKDDNVSAYKKIRFEL